MNVNGVLVVLSLLAVAGCGAASPGAVDSGADASVLDEGTSDLAVARCDAAPSVAHFTTEDGETLEADYYPTGVVGSPAAILFHMIPPANDRRNFPAAFIDALHAAGIAVLNVDRRGAGGSTGTAADAYLGPGGRLDALAAWRILASDACAIDTTRIALVGASNGTASVLDFTVGAATDTPPAVPRALVWLSGGTYTEAQNNIAEHRVLLDTLPILYVYPSAEAPWNVALRVAAPTTWTFLEYTPGAHGTRVFDATPASVGAVADWIVAALAP